MELFFLRSRLDETIGVRQIPAIDNRFPRSENFRFLDFQIPMIPDSRLSARGSRGTAPRHKVAEIWGTRAIP